MYVYACPQHGRVRLGVSTPLQREPGRRHAGSPALSRQRTLADRSRSTRRPNCRLTSDCSASWVSTSREAVHESISGWVRMRGSARSLRCRVAVRRRPHAGSGTGRRARRPGHAACVSRRRAPGHPRFCPRAPRTRRPTEPRAQPRGRARRSSRNSDPVAQRSSGRNASG